LGFFGGREGKCISFFVTQMWDIVIVFLLRIHFSWAFSEKDLGRSRNYMVNVKGKEMIHSCIFLSVFLFLFLSAATS